MPSVKPPSKQIMIGMMIALGVALLPMPYGYYTLLRLVCTGISIWNCVAAHEQGRKQDVWLWGGVAAIYNPIFPLHLTRAIWSIVNIATIAFIVWAQKKASRPEI